MATIDLHTGDYAVDDDEREATQQLLGRHPDARGRIWYRRVGDERAHRIGTLSRTSARSRSRWPAERFISCRFHVRMSASSERGTAP